MTAPGSWEVTGYYAVQLLPEQAPLETPVRLAETGIIEPRPLSLGDVLSSTFRAVRYAPMTMFGLTLVVMAVAELLGLGISFVLIRQVSSVNPQDDLGGIASLIGLSVMTTMLATAVATIVVQMGLAFTVHEAVFARRTTPAAALRRLRSRTGAALAFSALTGLGYLVVIAVVGIGVSALVAAAEDSGWLMLVLVVPAVVAALLWISVRLLLAPCAIAIEKAGPIQAIRRSWTLTRGLFWRTLGIYLVASVIISMAASTVSSVFSFAGAMIGMGDMTVGMIVTTTASTLVSLVLSVPLTTAVVTLLYVDARIRREGYELQIAEALYG